MLEAGIKSQAELARRIADIEGLDSEPKDLVNRIFRQIKVEHSSLERVANALNVDAYKLYLTQDDQILIADNQKASIKNDNLNTQQEKHKQLNFNALYAVFVLVVITVIGFYVRNSSSLVGINPNSESVLLFPRSKSLYPLAQDIITQLNNERIGLVPQALFDDFKLDDEVLSNYEVDAIWVLEVEQYDRFRSIFLSRYIDTDIADLYGETQENNLVTVAAINLSQSELVQAHRYIGQVFKQVLNHWHETKSDLSSEEIKKTASIVIQTRQLTEQYFNENNTAKAISMLETLAAANAESLAIQCLLKVQIGWQNNEKNDFKQAHELCEKALMLDSKHPFILTTNAYRLFRNGEYEKAAQSYYNILKQYPNNIEGLLGQAELNLKYYLEAPTERETVLQSTITQVQKAILHDPAYWKSYNLLASIFYLTNQSQRALEVIKKLNEIAPNQLTLANGALLSLCHDQLNDAMSYSQRVINIDPDAYIAHETMFYVHTYEGQLTMALAVMQKAMKLFKKNQGGLYLQWGQLADAYRWLDQKEFAIEYYKKALIEYEQDKIKKQTTRNDQVFALYYQSAIEHMKGHKLPTTINAELALLNINTMPSSNQLKAAIIYKWLDQQEVMLSIKKQITEVCPIYQKAVDFRSES